MYKRLIVLALVLGLASISFADILIGNYEQSMSDNWVPGPQDSPTLESDTLGVGATLGDMSLQVHTSGGYWTLQWQAPVVLDLYDMTSLTLDLTMIADEWPGWGWTQIDKLAINSDSTAYPEGGAWQEYTPTAIDRLTGLPVGTDWGRWNGDAYKTITWDLTANPYDDTGATYLQFNIALNNPMPDTGAFYIDNVVLHGPIVGDLTGGGVVMPPCVPEPMTIALLGLGGLALLRRKRA